ncbi:hypothetical protein R1sor_010682 [Riccia sorocarpa]|uniref:Uncharacterized protein n=1 Tax=Riccia sorocarpa TaxID=122646 RepID=A0ABD3I057_9MARC
MEVVGKLDKRATQEMNRILATAPDPKEIVQQVKDLAAGKVPGLDGITTEVLRARWDSIKFNSHDSGVLAGWKTYHEGVKRQISSPENYFQQFSGAKSQVGLGSSIGVKDYVFRTRFVKTYENIHHNYLWVTLETLGFKQEVTKLMKGLMTDAEEVVHDNGNFTKDFQTDRGVREGCPLPLSSSHHLQNLSWSC